MFLVSAALVVVAFVLLAVGVVTAKLTLVYFAIGVAVVSMILLVVGMFLQRELFWGGRAGNRDADAGEEEQPEPVAAASAGRAGRASATSAATRSPAPGSAATAEHAPAQAPHEVPGPGEPRAGPAPGRSSPVVHGEEPAAAELVHVVPGRRRYHRAGCASLVGRVSEELTIDEAREEGFSACTACFPAEPAAETDPETADETAGETAAETAAGTARGTATETTIKAAAVTAGESGTAADRSPSGKASGVQRATERLHRDSGKPDTPARPEESVTPAHGLAVGGALADSAEPVAGGEAAAEPGGTAAAAGAASTSGSGAAAEGVTDFERVSDFRPATDFEGVSHFESATAAESAGAAASAGAAESTGAAESARAEAGGKPGEPAPGSNETVWVVRGVSRYHRSDCVLIRSVDEEDVDTMTRADAEATGCTPCRACHAIDEPLAG